MLSVTPGPSGSDSGWLSWVREEGQACSCVLSSPCRPRWCMSSPSPAPAVVLPFDSSSSPLPPTHPAEAQSDTATSAGPSSPGAEPPRAPEALAGPERAPPPFGARPPHPTRLSVLGSFRSFHSYQQSSYLGCFCSVWKPSELSDSLLGPPVRV